MVIISSLESSVEIQKRVKFSTLYPQYKDAFAEYVKNDKLMYRFPNTDFYLRSKEPNYLDWVICVWVIGK